jgi:hypothetical protein
LDFFVSEVRVLDMSKLGSGVTASVLSDAWKIVYLEISHIRYGPGDDMGF